MLKFIKDRQTKGKRAEALAIKHLENQGLRLIEKNFFCRTGEIDIIMLDNDYLVFVEVRYRQRVEHGHPLESIDYRKQQKLLRSIQYYLLKNAGYANLPCRIDAVAIYVSNSENQSEEKIMWVKNALQLGL